MKYIKGFDALRAASIILVILTHLGMYEWLPDNHYCRTRVWQLVSGTTGVQVFFSISGFLITTILLLEFQRNGRIHFVGFFARRFLRLMPPLIVLYIVVAILIKSAMIPYSREGFLLAVFYLYNFAPLRFSMAEIGHTWSLALEEQFYLFWPFVIRFLTRVRSLLMVIVAFVLLSGIAAFVYPKLWFAPFFNMDRWFIPAIAPVMIGSGFAVLNFFPTTGWQTFFAENKRTLIIGCLLFLYPLYGPLTEIAFIFQSIGISGILVWITHNQQAKLTAVLETRWISYIGKISYGLYVYQGLYLRTGPSGVLWIQQFPQNIFLTLVTAVLSFHLLEKPVLRLKKRFRAPPNMESKK